MKDNSVEFQDTGFITEEARILCQNHLERETFDFVEITGGTYKKILMYHGWRESTKNRGIGRNLSSTSPTRSCRG